MDNKLGSKAIDCAHRSIGVTESKTPPNWGKWVKVYLTFVGIFKPAPWCAAFAAYKIHQAAGELNEKVYWPKTGSVQSTVNWAKKHSQISDIPIPGWAFVKYDWKLKRYAHIGFIDGVFTQENKIKTVEGNSNNDGSREGREVVAIYRKWDSNYKAIRIV